MVAVSLMGLVLLMVNPNISRYRPTHERAYNTYSTLDRAQARTFTNHPTPSLP